MRDDDAQRLPGGPAGAPRRPAGALESEVLAILREADGALSPATSVSGSPTAGTETGRAGNCRTAAS